MKTLPTKGYMRDTAARFNRSPAVKPPLRAMLILCSDDDFGAGLIAECHAAIVLQTPGGAAAASEPQARATLEYAVLHERVRRVVVLAHQGCRSVRGALPGGPRERALAQWQSLVNDEFSRPLLHANGVDVRMLWVDATSGEVCAFRTDDQRLAPMGCGDLERMLASLEERTS